MTVKCCGQRAAWFFFAFLRSGEFTCPSRSAYTQAMLSSHDITVDNRDNPTQVFVK